MGCFINYKRVVLKDTKLLTFFFGTIFLSFFAQFFFVFFCIFVSYFSGVERKNIKIIKMTNFMSFFY